MRLLFQHAKEFLKNLSTGVFGGIVVVVGVALFVVALSKFGGLMDAYYNPLPTWIRGTIGVSILSLATTLALAKWGEKIREDLAMSRFRATLSR
ncbi:MAG: hypothetical protein A3D67_01675 [Candidatus Lloydbacteria bacterium RIFCSPHIGHO2_02_FULL_51_22]|uniref:Uncharacterized protein n=3 Tax=Candidatus Lloydiibacteriota TaxID=1817910 RepID=A0A1G2DGD9_9BACT|nr:MAG: hypothetical protein A3D67_01675 [Candidatus Lloydbacteria bacterium RIFCSPHIGHO2_02_FULL_51_22]OGZ14763.1 MAG: hypothetical protein A3J08_04280 [Candidatus Lloydbacteria bacterium RIFCSPLOWO2_02_FULL_51_11]OGZ16546.1 MAG: hypothetical protein A3G11_02200 [Candidatus Lloydbacteria bacterium RIFCSPLOWO2_12_FULL_51_9]